MRAAEIAAIVQLASTLAPPVLEFVNNVMRALDTSGMTGEQRMKAIVEMQATLKPMAPVPE